MSNQNDQGKERYNSLNVVRTLGCIVILMFHVMVNENYNLKNDFVVILGFTAVCLMYFFMTISAFGLCSGYMEKILNGTINLQEFYRKRILKILPFFTFMVIIDLVSGFNINKLYEAFADITLLFGLFPNEITVIGIGWFVGIIFAFYIMFPFYCVITANRVRTWITLTVSIILNYLCRYYFNTGSHNIIYCLCFFVAGTLIYHYREEILKSGVLVFLICIAIISVSGLLSRSYGDDTLLLLIIIGAAMTIAISSWGQHIKGRVFDFIGSISYEIYLCHTAVFRMVEKMGLHYKLGNGVLGYLSTCLITLMGAIAFSYVMAKVISLSLEKMRLRLHQKEQKEN